MKSLKCYIKDILDIDYITISETWANGLGFVRVNMIVESYGATKEKEKLFSLDEWEEISKQGYYIN